MAACRIIFPRSTAGTFFQTSKRSLRLKANSALSRSSIRGVGNTPYFFGWLPD
jgi:hypothetical protein